MGKLIGSHRDPAQQFSFSRLCWVLLRGGLSLIALLLAVSFISFVLISLSPIDPVEANVGQAAYMNMSPEKKAQLLAHWGDGTPMLQRYWDWLTSFIAGDMGISLRFNAPVSQVIATKFSTSVLMLATAWLLSGVLGFVLGVVAAAREGSLLSKAIHGFCLLLASTPTFWFGLLVLMVFGVYLGVIPIGFASPIGKAAEDITFWDLFRHAIGPALTLSIVGISNVALHTRQKLLDVMETDYFLFARARGLGLWHVIRRHGLRNIILPALTLQFASISEIFGGSILVEQVFSYPGLGQATVVAGLGSDVALLAAIAVFSAAIVFVGNATADLLYRVIDPRMRAGVSNV
ncbi:oligopeptide ABC transporter permease [Actinobaculum suis]|uniref:Oligopeptide ABC transporter permease n=1 Tax=Actinobaculum suis TaxID=1657 RepID=A0A7Z8Y9X1_9ACTO|nr:ABC transporter permease [Actinobaculum suis]VDG77030.1 oligopeptide ABC transporter permease [Actinobaculum suis]